MASAPASRAARISRSVRRYVSDGEFPGRRTEKSAARTCAADRSASEKTATVEIPRSRQDRIMRQAISPRFATRSLRIIGWSSHSEYAETVADTFDGSVVRDGQTNPQHRAGVAGVDDPVVEQ